MCTCLHVCVCVCVCVCAQMVHVLVVKEGLDTPVSFTPSTTTELLQLVACSHRFGPGTLETDDCVVVEGALALHDGIRLKWYPKPEGKVFGCIQKLNVRWLFSLNMAIALLILVAVSLLPQRLVNCVGKTTSGTFCTLHTCGNLQCCAAHYT